MYNIYYNIYNIFQIYIDRVIFVGYYDVPIVPNLTTVIADDTDYNNIRPSSMLHHNMLPDFVTVSSVRAPKRRQDDQRAADRSAGEHAQELSIASRERLEFFRRMSG